MTYIERCSSSCLNPKPSVSNTYQQCINHITQFFFRGSKFLFNSIILSTAMARSDQGNCIKAHGKHNQSDMNDVYVGMV